MIARKYCLNAPRTLRGDCQGFGVLFRPVLANADIVINVINMLDEADETTRRTMILDTPSPLQRLIDVVKQLEDKREQFHIGMIALIQWNINKDFHYLCIHWDLTELIVLSNPLII